MNDNIRDRIQQRLDELGLSPRAASLASGMSDSVIRDIFRRPDNSPTLETVRKLAVALQTTPEWLAFGSEERGTIPFTGDQLKELREEKGWTQEQAAEAMRISPSAYAKLERPGCKLNELMIKIATIAFQGLEGIGPNLELIGRGTTGGDVTPVQTRLVPAAYGGVVEAGAFRPVDEFADVEPPRLNAEPDPDFPSAQLVFFDVAGDSMNKLRPRPILAGDRVVGLSFPSLRGRMALRDGMVVVVQQSFDSGGYLERSVKQLELYEDRVEFHPRSDNPRHKPIVIPRETDPDNGREVEILAIVRRIVNEIPIS